MIKSIAVFFALLTLGACTMTKRVHNPGWHVEWKNTFSVKDEFTSEDSPSNGQVLSDNSISRELHVEAQEHQSLAVQDDTESFVQENPSQSLKKNAGSIFGYEKTETSTRSEGGILHKRKTDIIDSEVDNRKIHPYIFVSLGLLIGSILLLIVLFSGAAAGMAVALILFLLLSSLLGLVSFIFASTARREITKSPKKWKGRAGALVLFVLGVVSFGVGVLIWLIVLMILAIFKDINFVGFM
jgi:hypothetical protein